MYKKRGFVLYILNNIGNTKEGFLAFDEFFFFFIEITDEEAY